MESMDELLSPQDLFAFLRAELHAPSPEWEILERHLISVQGREGNDFVWDYLVDVSREVVGACDDRSWRILGLAGSLAYGHPRTVARAEVLHKWSRAERGECAAALACFVRWVRVGRLSLEEGLQVSLEGLERMANPTSEEVRALVELASATMAREFLAQEPGGFLRATEVLLSCCRGARNWQAEEAFLKVMGRASTISKETQAEVFSLLKEELSPAGFGADPGVHKGRFAYQDMLGSRSFAPVSAAARDAAAIAGFRELFLFGGVWGEDLGVRVREDLWERGASLLREAGVLIPEYRDGFPAPLAYRERVSLGGQGHPDALPFGRAIEASALLAFVGEDARSQRLARHVIESMDRLMGDSVRGSFFHSLYPLARDLAYPRR